MNKNSFRHYYNYNNQPISPFFAANNGCHTDLYKKGLALGVLINHVTPTNTFRAVNTSEIVSEHGHMDSDISYASMHELAGLGLQFPPDSYKRYKKSFNASYILNSSLCFVSKQTKQGVKSFFATKSIPVLEALKDRLTPQDQPRVAKHFKGLETPLMSGVSELTEGSFEVVSLTPEVDGLRLGRAKINLHSKNTYINTMMNVGIYNDSLIAFLSRHQAKIFYQEDGEPNVLTTSLIPALTAQWLGAKSENEVKNVLEGTQDLYNLSNVILPDYSHRGDFVTVPILNITNIQSIKK